MYDLTRRMGERTPSRKMSGKERSDYLAINKQKYPDSVHESHAKKETNWVDPHGKFIWLDNEAVFGFGKHKGKSIKEIARTDKGYLLWIASADFSGYVKDIVNRAINGEFPNYQYREGPFWV